MLRLLTLALFSAALLTSCVNSDRSTSSGDAEKPNPVAPMPAEDEPTGEITNENYTLKVTDATQKSPRKELTGKVNGVDVTIDYGSPAVNDRVIFGDLVPYGKVWRTGANEATRITFTEDVVVGKEAKPLSAGTYSLFTLPADKNQWTVIFNRDAEQWGAYDYKDERDAARVTGMAAPLQNAAERMDFATDQESVKFMWSDVMVSFPVAKASR